MSPKIALKTTRVTHAAAAPATVSTEITQDLSSEKLLREVEASLARTKLTRTESGSGSDSAAWAARRAAAAAAEVAGGMSGGLRAASRSPSARLVEADKRLRGDGDVSAKTSPFAAAVAKATDSSPESSNESTGTTNASASVTSHGVGRTPVMDGEEYTSRRPQEKSPLGKYVPGAVGSPGSSGVSQWMDTVVARAKVMRGGATVGDRESENAKVTGAESKFPGVKNILGDVSLPAPAEGDENVAAMTLSELRQVIADQKAAMRVIASKYASLKETRRDDLARNEETTKATLEKALRRGDAFETELRLASRRCAEIENGRRSARAALAEMASQNARLVSAFSVKKEEVITLRGEVEQARHTKNTKATGAEDLYRNAAAEVTTLRNTLTQTSDTLSQKNTELLDSKREITRLRDAIDAAKRREARGETGAEAAGTKAREETLAARVARKELEVERASFAAERGRWEGERKRWAGEIATVRAAAAAAASARPGSASAEASKKREEGVPPPHNAAFRDPYKGTRSQPVSPTKTSSFTESIRSKQLSPLRKAQSFGETNREKHSARSAPVSPSKEDPSSRTTSLQKSPGPNASPRRVAEHHKVRGNNEFHAKRYDRALAQYTAGLACAFDDDTFRAVLHANRAAAHQALQRFCDAVMDCCVSNFLDPSYQRALQRRADAYLSMGDWPSAAKDLATLAPSMGPECSLKLNEAKRKSLKGVVVVRISHPTRSASAITRTRPDEGTAIPLTFYVIRVTRD